MRIIISKLLLLQCLVSALAACGSVEYRDRPVMVSPEIAMAGQADKAFHEGSNQWMVTRVCSSSPIFDLNGNYVRTTVRCY